MKPSPPKRDGQYLAPTQPHNVKLKVLAQATRRRNAQRTQLLTTPGLASHSAQRLRRPRVTLTARPWSVFDKIKFDYLTLTC